MTGPQFFRLAWRISAYEGVITMRLRAQQEAGSAPAAPRRDTPAPSASPTATPGHREVGFDQFGAMFPDLVSRTVVKDG